MTTLGSSIQILDSYMNRRYHHYDRFEKIDGKATFLPVCHSVTPGKVVTVNITREGFQKSISITAGIADHEMENNPVISSIIKAQSEEKK